MTYKVQSTNIKNLNFQKYEDQIKRDDHIISEIDLEKN